MGCENKRAFLSQYFGYQVQSYGIVDRADRIARQHTVPNYTPTNPLTFTTEMGFNGYRYGLDARKILSPFFTSGYGGIFPVKEQPRISAPLPYEVPVLT